MDNRLIAVTGSDGFVGKALCSELESRGYSVRRLVRASTNELDNEVSVGNIDGGTDWKAALSGVTTIIHCAARAHLPLSKQSMDAVDLYRVINTLGTLNLAEQAAAEGVKRFIFLSSIKVNGESTSHPSFFKVKVGNPFSIGDIPRPLDAYGISKFEAECGLQQISKSFGMELVIVRSPLVYGPGVKANFLRLLKLVQAGYVLPFGLVNNKRSLIGLFNLVDFLICCIWNNNAVCQTFLVSDGEDLSTPELLRKISNAFARSGVQGSISLVLLPIPAWILRLTFYLCRKSSLTSRLIDSLQIDITHAHEKLGWTPPRSVDEGLFDTIVSMR